MRTFTTVVKPIQEDDTVGSSRSPVLLAKLREQEKEIREKEKQIKILQQNLKKEVAEKDVLSLEKKNTYEPTQGITRKCKNK